MGDITGFNCTYIILTQYLGDLYTMNIARLTKCELKSEGCVF